MEVPEGLSPLQYAMKICEDLGIPGRGNMQMIGEAIEAISKGRIFRGHPRAIEHAFIWLSRRVKVAQEQGQTINNLWFMNGLYNEVKKPLPEPQRIKVEHLGKGYGTQDMLWLYHRYQAKRKALPNRALTEGEVEGLLNELDEKRGETPAWRLQRVGREVPTE